MAPSYEVFEHGADVGVRGFGRSLEEAFANAAKAMFSLMVEDFDQIKPNRRIENITCLADDLESLLVFWLNRLLSLADMEKMIFCHFGPRIKGLRLTGWAAGETLDPSRHRLGVEVKGATYTMARVAKDGDLYVAQCVVDV